MTHGREHLQRLALGQVRPDQPTTPARGATPRTPPAVVRTEVLSRSVITRLGIQALLDDFTDRVVTTERGRNRAAADVVIFDMPEDHAEACNALEHLSREPAAVIAIVPASSPRISTRARALGADACITSMITGAELVEVIHAVAAGLVGTPGIPGTAPGVVPPAAGPERAGSDIGLTTREQQIIALVAKGMTNDEIAGKLYLSLNSVKTYLRTSYPKIGARNRTQAVLWALQQPPAPVQ